MWRFFAPERVLLAWDEYMEYTGKYWSLRGMYFYRLFPFNTDKELFGLQYLGKPTNVLPDVFLTTNLRFPVPGCVHLIEIVL
jgi:hypothetical protein